MSLNSNKEEYKIDLNVDIITDETNSKILTSFFKFFLLHYNIIPFRFENFKYYADCFKKLLDDGNRNIDVDWNMAQINKQQEQVIELSDNINYLIREIYSEFKTSLVTEVAIFYGTTVLTPKEIYVFRFPTNTSYHLSENHNVKDGTILSCLTQFINVISNVNSRTKISNNTNLYVLYKKPSLGTSLDYSEESLYKNNELNDIMESCPNKYVFQLKKEYESENYVPLNCCKELIVYEDLSNLNLVESVKEKTQNNKIGKPIDSFEWNQSKITIKRYECRKIRGKEIWEYL